MSFKVIQGHRSLVPIESQYATSCRWIILTYTLPHTVFNKLRSIGHIFAVDCLQVYTCKYDRRLMQFRQHEFHWLDVDDRVRFRVCVQVYKCLHNMAPGYLSALRQPVSMRSWSPSPTLSWSWWTGLPPCQSVHIRGTVVCLRQSYILEGWNSLPDNLKNVNLSLQTY